MRYNAITDHDTVFEVPEQSLNDKRVFIGLTNLGPDSKHDGARQWAYSVGRGPWDDDVRYQGEDLHGPVSAGPDGYPDAGKMAASLMSFLSAYAEGYMQGSSTETSVLYYDDEPVATGDAAWFISENGERFGIASADLEGGYTHWIKHPDDAYMRTDVYKAEFTGKEVE